MKKKIIGCICFCFIVCLLFIPNEPSIPILGYHDIVCDETKIDSRYTLSLSDFEEQMKYLYDNGYTPLFLSEIDSTKNYDKPIVVTFDDGYKNIYDYAYPILKKYNVKSSFYILVEKKDKDGNVITTKKVGSPDIVRKGICDYKIERIMCDESEQKFIFIVEKILEDETGISIRYMVEAAEID